MSRLAYILILFSFWAPGLSATEYKSLSLVEYGRLDSLENGEFVTVKEFRISYGNTDPQDAVASSSFRLSLGAIGMNAAFYYHNPDGTWNLFNFQMPLESLDAAGIEDRLRYREFLARPEVLAVLEKPYDKIDFGKEGEFIYKRMGLTTAQLPEPFNRFLPQDLETIESIFQYNADGTAKIYFRKPFDRDGYAQPVFESLAKSIR